MNDLATGAFKAAFALTSETAYNAGLSAQKRRVLAGLLEIARRHAAEIQASDTLLDVMEEVGAMMRALPESGDPQ